MSILERPGGGDLAGAVEERRFEEQRLWQESLKRRDEAVTALDRARSGKLEPCRPTPTLDPLGPLDDDEVRYAAETGRWIQEFEYYSPVRRWIAVRVSRIVLFLTGFINTHQRRYNHLVLDRMAKLQQRVDELTERVNFLEGSRVDDPAPDLAESAPLADLEGASLGRLRQEVERLRLEVLDQKVEVSSLQAERLGRRLRDLDAVEKD